MSQLKKKRKKKKVYKTTLLQDELRLFLEEVILRCSTGF